MAKEKELARELAKGIARNLSGTSLVEEAQDGVDDYKRPGGVDLYRRPGGVDLYKRPFGS